MAYMEKQNRRMKNSPQEVWDWEGRSVQLPWAFVAHFTYLHCTVEKSNHYNSHICSSMTYIWTWLTPTRASCCHYNAPLQPPVYHQAQHWDHTLGPGHATFCPMGMSNYRRWSSQVAEFPASTTPFHHSKFATCDRCQWCPASSTLSDQKYSSHKPSHRHLNQNLLKSVDLRSWGIYRIGENSLHKSLLRHWLFHAGL